ncbi:MAG: SDR family NAD(P)-dependent oxidoreductase, partial [Alphaproteobacteria bacterium]|nr:SDR family NAD(P)-dependent oxidoreductase [Alphaproteobacteria bacterium]
MKRAFVTGGNRGIGKAIAAGLLREGLNVFIGARDAASGHAAAEEIGATYLYCDLSQPLTLPPEAAEMHVIVNNAGVLFDAPLFSQKARFDDTLSVMVQGPYALIGQALGFMRKEGYGRVVNVSSGWGSFAEGLGGPGAYGVAKAGLNALTVAAARAVPRGVKVNAMCPGWVHTRMGGSA